jgi:hypothetical protein
MTVFSQLRLYAGTAVNVEQYPPTTFAKNETGRSGEGAAYLFHPAILGYLPTTFVHEAFDDAVLLAR